MFLAYNQARLEFCPYFRYKYIIAVQTLKLSCPLNGKMTPLGTLALQKGGLLCFRYSPEWQERGYALSPDLGVCSEYIYRRYFGFLNDIMPDRWGKTLIRMENPGPISDLVYVLGVHPDARMEAIEIAGQPNSIKIPDLLSPRLAEEFFVIIHKYQAGEDLKEEELRKLIEQGSSLGGSRPKASMWGRKLGLCIVKFPSRQDTYNVPLFEKLSLDMARDCGVDTQKSYLIPVEKNRHALVIQRFDRSPDGSKIHYASAMTACDKRDSEDASYLDIASRMKNEDDRKELWKRLLFNVMTSNKDDHLRNHGFLRKGNEWRLSPIFDLESNPLATSHRLSLDDQGSLIAEPEQIIAMAPYYDLEEDEAIEEFSKMREVISTWRERAERLGAAKFDLKLMAPCFQNIAAESAIPLERSKRK